MRFSFSRLHIVRCIFVFAALVLAAPLSAAHAQQAIDPTTVADAYGDLSVFILNVAAGLDGTPRSPDDERLFHDAFAETLLSAWPSLGPDDQATLGQLPRLRSTVRAAWPRLTEEERDQIAEQWRPMVQSELAGVPCQTYDALARAYLLPGGDSATIAANRDHLVECWKQHPELARGENGEDLSVERQRQDASDGDTAYRGMMNAEVTNYAGTMNMLSIMSGDPYRWTVR